jgi:hypothetical protein
MKLKPATTALLASLLGCATASAVPLTYDGLMGSQTTTLNVNIPAHGSTAAFSYSGGVYVGFHTYHIESGSFQQYKSFCIDFYDHTSTATHEYTATSLESAPLSTFGDVAMGAGASQTIKALWALNYDDALAAATAATPNYTKSAELQLAIWKAIAIGSGGTATGSTYNAGANTMLASAASYSGTLPGLFAWSNSDAYEKFQDFIGIPNSPIDPPPGVPDGGATVALLGIALSGLAAIRKKL